MKAEDLIVRINPAEIKFSSSRSSGPGGQNVNKVNTRVELRFNILSSASLTDEEKDLIISVLGKRITKEGDLLVVSQSERTQLKNKERAIANFYKLLSGALTVRTERKETKPTPASVERRIERKKKRGIIKSLRKDQDIIHP